MRRALPVLVVAALVLLGAPAADAAEHKTAAQLRADRQALVQRIASLTDDAARAQQALADATEREALAEIALVDARRDYAAFAVEAYIQGVGAGEVEQLKRRAFSDTLAETDREALVDLQRLRAASEAEQQHAEDALDDARAAAVTLDQLRVQLEKTITERVAYEAAQAEAAAARARASSASAAVPRHRRVTMGQYDLMRTYRFGPGSGVPAGLVATGQVLEGRASWYGPGFDGRPTASGAIFDQEAWTVAHRTLPLGTILLITRGERQVVALVNDRGPFVGGRILDLSRGVADALGTVSAGVASVRAEILVPA